MKSVNKFMRACALLMAVAMCHGAEEPPKTQEISITNGTENSIYFAIYRVQVKGEIV